MGSFGKIQLFMLHLLLSAYCVKVAYAAAMDMGFKDCEWWGFRLCEECLSIVSSKLEEIGLDFLPFRQREFR
jgi:hypothetical protein